jgi:hypothetical protein
MDRLGYCTVFSLTYGAILSAFIGQVQLPTLLCCVTSKYVAFVALVTMVGPEYQPRPRILCHAAKHRRPPQ